MRPRVLDRLGDEFVRVAEADAAAGVRRLRWPALGLVLLVGTGGAVAGAQLLTADDVPPPDRAHLPPEQRPVEGSGRLAGLMVPDPDGGPAWDLRLSRAESGQTCTAVGQMQDGRFGIVGLDGRFRALPLLGASACAERLRGEPSLVGARGLAGGRETAERTVVSGLAGTGAERVLVRVEGRRRAVRAALADGDGAFLAVLPGLPDTLAPRVTVSYRDGRSRTVELGGRTRGQLGDPDGGRAWLPRIEPDRRPGARRGQLCVWLLQATGSGGNGPPVHSVPRCGDTRRDAAFADARRYVPHDRFVAGPRGVFGRAPSRTVLTGAVATQVRSVRVLVPGRRPQRLIPTSRGAVFAIWTGAVDPQDVVLELRTAAGGTLRLRGPANLRTPAGLPFDPGRSPADRPVPPQRKLTPPIGVRDARVVARAPDPAGGPDHAVRALTVESRTAPGIPVAPRRVARCFQLGRVGADGRFGRLDARGGIVAVEPESMSCVGADVGDRLGQLTDLIDDPGSAAARIVQTTIWGHGGGPGSVALTIDGRRERVKAGAEGVFLRPLEPGRRLERVTVDGRHVFGTRGRGVAGGRGGPRRPVFLAAANPTPDARAPDPAGGPPWAVAIATLAGRPCSDVTRLIGGQPGLPVGADGTFHRALAFCAGPRLVPRRRAVELRLRWFPPELSPAAAAQERLVRALPGRTVIVGRTAPGVTLVTVRSGRELRALRPTAAGHFIVVVDGEVDRRAVSAVARFADGRRVTARPPGR